MRWINVLLLTGVVLLFSSFKQEEPKSKVTKYTTGNGLPLKVINSITQDKAGFMWFGADDGLARFDGYSFKVFKNNPNNPASLSHNYVIWVFTDSEGIVWTSSRKGINSFDPKTERFIHYQHDPKNTSSLVGDNVSHISENIAGNLWVSSWRAGFTYVDKKNAKFIQYSQKNLPGLSSLKVMCAYEDKEGLLWVGSREGGLDVFKTSNGLITEKVKLAYDNIPPIRNVRCISPDHLGNIWIGTAEGLVYFDKKKGRFQVLNTANSGLKGDAIRSLLVDSKQNLWIGVQDKGLHMLSLKNLHDTPLTDLTVTSVRGEDEYATYKHSIHSIYEDRDGNIWLATNGDGVQMISGVKEKFMRIEIKQTQESERPYLRFWGMCTDENDNLWLGTDGNGIYQYNSHGNLLKHYSADGKKGSLTDNAILCAFRDHNNTLWFGTYSKGLFRYNKETDSFTNYKYDPEDPLSLGHNDVRVIFEDSKHNLWIGTNWGGLNLFHEQTETFTRYTHNNSSLSSSDVRAIIEDKKGGLWLGGSEGGINYFDPESKRFWQHFNDPDDKINLVSNMVYALHLDRYGKLWIGADGIGLVIYDPEQKKLQLRNEKDGLYCSTVFAIQEDNAGNIWMSTNTGITKWDHRAQKFYNYDRSDGLQNGQFNSCSFLHNKTSDLMAFAGTEGVTLFYPDAVKQNLRRPTVMITGFQLFNKPVEIGQSYGAKAILEQSIIQTRDITLKYDQSVFTFEFTALNYTLPEKNQYAYKMERFDKSWNLVGASRTATYTNLDPGQYIFKVKGSNNDGIWNEQGTSVIINIIPPWWLTWWFRVLVVLGLTAIGIVAYKIRTRSIKQQNKKLERSVLEKTKQLQSANEELTLREEKIKAQNQDLSLQNEILIQRQEEISTQRDLLSDQNQRLEDAWKTIEKQNREILFHNKTLDHEVKERTQELVSYNQQLEQFAFISAHNLRAPVARILGLGKILELSKENPDEEKMIIDKLVSETLELDKVVKDVSAMLEIRRNNTYVMEPINLTEELNLIKANLENEIKETQTEIIGDFSKVNMVRTAKPYLDSILLNLIHNAIKYRDSNRKPYIHISTEITEEYVCLLIRDNGLGIDLELHHKNIFHLYKRFHSHVEGKGLGLYLVKTQVIALGGRIEVESKVNVGTLFKVFLKNWEVKDGIPVSPTQISLGNL